MLRPVSASAARMAATMRPASAGVSGPPCQPVPMRAVRRIAASDPPPIHIGRLACTGLGEMVAPDRR